MTTSIAREVSKRKNIGPAIDTFADDLVRELNTMVTLATTRRFPNAHYQKDPVGFFREVLGVEPWDRQIEFLEAVRDFSRIAICSGHKIGKSTFVAGVALWFYCSFEDARAIMSSTTSRQVDQILWRELRMLRARSGRCTHCKREDPEAFRIPRPCPHSAIIEGEQGELARTGLKSQDFREIVGFTAREAEAVAGISGRNLLYLIDEASGVPDEIYEAIEGNRAGGARIVLVGNGTRNEGEFFEAFNSKKHLYKTIRVSSETTPNVTLGRIVIPGLATLEWINEKKLEWGEHSSLYRVRVKGEHATHEEGKIFSLHAIGESEKRWHETPESGRLCIGLDPAGETGSGDETAFSARRGFKHILLRTYSGLNADQHLVHLLMLLKVLKLPPPAREEKPVVVLDREGSIGTKLAAKLRDYLEEHPDAFELVTVRASSAAIGERELYDRIRDQLAGNLETWMRSGGAILEDTKLSPELHAMEWKQTVSGKIKLTPKDVLRKELGRSPDRFDSLALSVWEPAYLRADVNAPPSVQREAASSVDQQQPYTEVPFLDSYAGAELWQKS